MNISDTSKSKPKYNMWQNTAWMVKIAWRAHKSVLFLVLASALASVSITTAQMLIAPVILSRVEETAPLRELCLTILAFALLLILLNGLNGYIGENTIFGRILVRVKIISLINQKNASTSYPNLLDTAFIQAEKKAMYAAEGNNKAAEAIWDTWKDILVAVMGFLVYLGLLSGLNPWLLLLVTFTAIVGYIVNKKVENWSYEHRQEESAYSNQMNYAKNVMVDRKFAKDIRIFGLTDWIEEVWENSYRLYRAFQVRRERRRLWITFADMMLSLLRNGAAYAYLIWLALSEGLSASEFLLYFNAISGFAEWIRLLLEQFGTLNTQSMDLSILREFLEWPEPFCFEEGKPLPGDRNGSYELTLEQVFYRYPEASEDTIRGVDLTIRPGEKLAVVGINGAGKTTLVRLLCGFLDPTQGRVLLNGQDIRQYDRRQYYRLFSTVFQDFSVVDATIAQNVAQKAVQIDEGKVLRCLDMAGLKEKVLSLPKGMDTQIGRSIYEDGIELSGGETQRLMLARALYKDGPVLVLDEPTAALDPIAENDIYLKYHEMTKGCTSLFISHRLASTRFCDRIIYMDHGQILEEGTHESLLAAQGEYARLFETQSQYYAGGGTQHGEE
ncbi:MAG: ABC transporter ATP-binding protein/permease [Lachnospiraceae bacterium]|nr:ABC transporter ATP-binding protein/permease [Lachnospiraceae bacterium]